MSALAEDWHHVQHGELVTFSGLCFMPLCFSPASVSKAAARDPSTGGIAVAMALQRAMIHAVSTDEETMALASDAFRSFVRAYATHPKVTW